MQFIKIFLFIFAWAIGPTVCFSSNRTSARVPVFGGTLAGPNDATYIVSIKHHHLHCCGGALITYKHVLSAAHCFVLDDKTIKTNIVVVAGTHHKFRGGIGIAPKEIFIHPDYDKAGQAFDIAVIQLHQAFQPSKYISTVALPRAPVSPNEKVVIFGFGDTSNDESLQSPYLQYYSSKALTNAKCTELYDKIENKTESMTESDICDLPRQGTGICYGDSGSPLVNFKNEIVGIASRGEKCAEGYPNIFVSVHYCLKFIKKHISHKFLWAV